MLISKVLPTFFAYRLVSAQDPSDLSLAIGKINLARLNKGIGALAWNDELAAWAGNWAGQMAIGTVPYGHASGDQRPSQGETLYVSWSTECDAHYNSPLESAADYWLAEEVGWAGEPVLTGQEPWLHWGEWLPAPLDKVCLEWWNDADTVKQRN